MQTGGRLVEDEKVAAFAVRFFRARIGEMPDEFQPLRFAAGKRVERLSEPQIAEPNFFEHIERLRKIFLLADLREELNRFGHGQLEHVVNRFAVQLHLQHVRLKTAAFAFRAAHIEIAQELHLDLFETGAGAALATAAAGVERERARGQSLRHRFRLRGEKFADAIVKTEIKNRRGTRRARERRLIDHHDVANAMRARDRFARAGFLIGRFAFGAQKIPIKHVVNERRFTGTGNAGHARENAERKIDIDVLQVVFARAGDLDRRCRSSPLFRNRNRFAAAEVIGGQGLVDRRPGDLNRSRESSESLRDFDLASRAERPIHLKIFERAAEDQFAAALAAARVRCRSNCRPRE